MDRNLLTEGVSDQYSRMVKINTYAHNVKYKGYQIDDIEGSSMNINFAIEIEARGWGIKDVSLYAIEGDKELDLEITYWVDDENTQIDNVSLPINWEILDTDSNTGEGVVTIGDELDVELGNDENGNIIVKGLSLPIYTI